MFYLLSLSLRILRCGGGTPMVAERRLFLGLVLSVATVVFGMPTAWADSFTLDPGSPTLGLIPATPGDILSDVGGPFPPPPPPPMISKPFAGPGGMGLLPGDVVDAISNGLDPVFGPHTDYFSVTRGSIGVPGTGVFLESSVLDTPPGLTPGHAGDIFVANGGLPVGVNILAPAGFGWTLGTTTGDEANTGLITPTPAGGGGDNVNSYDLSTIPPGAPTIFSLAPGSPTLGFFGATPADIFAVGGIYGPFPIILVPGAVLGLPPGADIDALAITVGPGFLGPGSIEYSLTAATAGLVPAALGSGATILGFGPGPVTVHTPASIGLLVGDDLDALDVDTLPVIPEPSSIVLFGVSVFCFVCCLKRRKQVAR
jgi:hypothetical protein